MYACVNSLNVVKNVTYVSNSLFPDAVQTEVHGSHIDDKDKEMFPVQQTVLPTRHV